MEQKQFQWGVRYGERMSSEPISLEQGIKQSTLHLRFLFQERSQLIVEYLFTLSVALKASLFARSNDLLVLDSTLIKNAVECWPMWFYFQTRLDPETADTIRKKLGMSIHELSALVFWSIVLPHHVDLPHPFVDLFYQTIIQIVVLSMTSFAHRLSFSALLCTQKTKPPPPVFSEIMTKRIIPIAITLALVRDRRDTSKFLNWLVWWCEREPPPIPEYSDVFEDVDEFFEKNLDIPKIIGYIIDTTLNGECNREQILELIELAASAKEQLTTICNDGVIIQMFIEPEKLEIFWRIGDFLNDRQSCLLTQNLIYLLERSCFILRTISSLCYLCPPNMAEDAKIVEIVTGVDSKSLMLLFATLEEKIQDGIDGNTKALQEAADVCGILKTIPPTTTSTHGACVIGTMWGLDEKNKIANIFLELIERGVSLTPVGDILSMAYGLKQMAKGKINKETQILHLLSTLFNFNTTLSSSEVDSLASDFNLDKRDFRENTSSSTDQLLPAAMALISVKEDNRGRLGDVLTPEAISEMKANSLHALLQSSTQRSIADVSLDLDIFRSVSKYLGIDYRGSRRKNRGSTKRKRRFNSKGSRGRRGGRDLSDSSDDSQSDNERFRSGRRRGRRIRDSDSSDDDRRPKRRNRRNRRDFYEDDDRPMNRRGRRNRRDFYSEDSDDTRGDWGGRGKKGRHRRSGNIMDIFSTRGRGNRNSRGYFGHN